MSLSTISWTSAQNAEEAGKHALFAGYQKDGKKVYVGRVTDSNGNQIPARIIPENNKSFYEENGEEKTTEQIEFLFHTEGYSWIKSGNGATIPEAVPIGNNYIGRGEVDGSVVVGKVDLDAKQLVSTFDGKVVFLSNYDVLVFKPSNKTQFQQLATNEFRETFISRSDASFNERIVVRDNSFYNQQRFLEMQNRIQNLELELSSYKNDRRNYEQRIAFEQKRVADLNMKIQSLKSENSIYLRERTTFEERASSESSRVSELEIKLQDMLNENTFLLRKVSGLEETLKSERYQMEIYTEKFKSSLNSNSSSGNKGLEDRIRLQQQRIFELENMLENGTADADSLKSQLSNYESTIEHQKIQVESILKKLHASNADNEFLIKKLGLLTQTLRNYQFEIESMASQLHNAKAIIGQLHAELARLNGALAKYQAAMSQAYILNGELMTKVSGYSTLSQLQTTTDSKLDILGLNFSKIEIASKPQSTLNTSALLEATGSETYLKYIRTSSTESESGNVSFTPYTPASESA